MTHLLTTLALILVLLLSAVLGWTLRRRLNERHLPDEAVTSVRLLMGMLLTFAAIVLGLLTSNAKQRFDGLSGDLSAFGAGLIELDGRLRSYGAEADELRRMLRLYTAAAIADSWPDEPKPGGDYPRLTRSGESGIEGKLLGEILGDVDRGIHALSPQDAFHTELAGRLRNRVVSVVEQRWRLIFASRSTISWPFLLTLTTWLSIIFAVFGMTSPPGRVVYTVVALSALSIGSPLFLILDYDDAMSGRIMLPSAPLRMALAHMDAP